MKKIDKHEFLPSAIEIVEKPPSPLGGIVIWTLLSLLLTGIIWSIVGRVDIVATARGKVIPGGRIKSIQPLEEGIIKEIYVEEGQDIIEGELLVELDATIKEADAHAILKTLSMYRLERRITEIEIAGRSLSMEELLSEYPELDKKKVSSEYRYYLSREDSFRGMGDEIRLNILQAGSEHDIANSNFLKTQNQLKFLSKEEENYRHLKEVGGVRGNDWLRKLNELEVIKHELNTRKYEVENTKTEILELKKKLENMTIKRRMELANKMVELEKDILSLETDLIKITKGFDLKKLYSPVNGRVNEIMVSTIGGVIGAGDPLMTIVPEDTPLLIEVLVLNKDIGFVMKGQKVEIKLDTFPFQKHGTIEGIVNKISPDAFEDEVRGLVYRVMVSLEENNIRHQGEVITMASGMTLTGEIKTGKRRIIEFFLSPLMKYTDESLKVR